MLLHQRANHADQKLKNHRKLISETSGQNPICLVKTWNPAEHNLPAREKTPVGTSSILV